MPLLLTRAVSDLGLWLIYLVARRRRSARKPPLRATPAELEQASAIVTHASRISACRALVGDKSFLFNPVHTTFVMYRIEAHTWIALGDPVGPEDEMPALVQGFQALCSRSGGRAVFYQIEEQYLALYRELGLAVYKLGEEGHVSLANFTLAGGDRRRLRQCHHRATRAGLSFEVVPAASIEPVLPDFKGISDAWLEHKHARE